MLSKFPSSSFRVRKITHRPVVEQAVSSGGTIRVDMSSPANWYMLGGDVSRVCWSATLTGATEYPAVTGTYDPIRVAGDRHALRWGAGACWASVRETLNSGGLEVSAVTDRNAVRPLWMARGLSSKRVGVLSNGGLRMVARGAVDAPTNGGNIYSGQGPNFGFNFEIPELISSGCSDQFARSQASTVLFPGAVASNFNGYSYSCPLSTFSRIGMNPVIPVGFLGAYNPSNGFSLEFRVAEAADAARTGQSATTLATAPQFLVITELRIEATYIEVLDEAVQRSIEGLFNKVNSVEVGGQMLTARLEMPVISYAPSSYDLSINSTQQILRIPSNSPSVRGLMLVVRPGSNNFGGALQAPRWRSIRVHVGGLCIQESPARERSQEAPDNMGSWLATESYRSAHLFSYFPPDEEAVKPDTALARFLYQKAGRIQNAGTSDAVAFTTYDCPSIIHLSFENSPHYSTDGTELNMAKGIDLRNIGELRLELEYADGAAADNANTPLGANIPIDILLAHDEVYSVDRSGATNITQFVF